MAKSDNDYIYSISDSDTITLNDYTLAAADSTFTITSNAHDYSPSIDLSNYTVDTVDVSSITTSGVTFDTDLNYNYTFETENYINPTEVSKMCKEYPALEKVWNNFKAVYDMVQQDYKGKKANGEIDDDIPF
jgi:hypothetical protein